MDLTTNYLGLKLKNPIIIGASNLSKDLNKAIELEKAGAAAIVYKSLFEEQLHLEAAELEDERHQYDDRNAEMINLFPDTAYAGPQIHLADLKKLKQAVSIPIIGSLNCLYNESWEEYAINMANTGIDALELNFYSTVSSAEKNAAQIETEQIETLKKVKKAVTIPVSVKLSSHYTNPLAFITQLDKSGANGLILFNRLFQPFIDIKNEKLVMPYNLSQKGDNRLSLRFMGLLSGEIKGSLCSNTGILSGEDMIAAILAGADAVQVVSTIYQNGIKQIGKMLDELTLFMKEKKYVSLSEFKGKLSKASLKMPYAYQRAQYVDFLMTSNENNNKYPVH
jgi:dihydroorotate dehydrogenase (fumarate)